MFKPSSEGQRHCSVQCAETELNSMRQWQDSLQPSEEISEVEYYTFSNAAKVMGCSRQYVYKLVSEGKLRASRISKRMSFIRKTDIEQMLSASPYHRVLSIDIAKERRAMRTIADTSVMTGCSARTIYNKVKEHDIPVCRVNGKKYVDTQALSVVMDERKNEILKTEDSDVEWILASECAQMYDKTEASIKTYVYRHDIPAKWINGRRYYSKTHLDRRLLHGNADDGIDMQDYYSISDLYRKFGIPKNNAATYASKHGIKILHKGKNTLFLKSDVDSHFSSLEQNHRQ